MKMFDARPVSYDSDGVPLFIAPIHPELPDDKTLERIRKDMYSRSPLLLRPRQSHSIYTPVNVYPPVDLPRSDSICEHTEIQQARKDSVDQQSGITAVTLTESAERPAFPTPSNKSFSSRFKYHSLDASRQEIRLLKVHPKRLFIDEIPEVFPNWSHLNQQHMRCYPPNGRLESAKQPVFDSVHAQAIAHGRIDPQHLPLDFDFAGKSLPSVDACQLPFGWGMARGLTPYWYLNESCMSARDLTSPSMAALHQSRGLRLTVICRYCRRSRR